MEVIGFTCIPKIKLSFTHDDLQLLMKYSHKHYDCHCCSVGEPGGFLYGMNNHFSGDPKERSTFNLTFREVDTLAKITECYTALHPVELFKLHLQLRDAMNQLNNVRFVAL